MADNRTRAVTLKHETAGINAGELHIQTFNKQDRIRRAAYAWLISWALALGSLPILFAHWVLVPVFIIAGPIMAYRYYHITSVPKKITGICPSCEKELELKLETSDQLPSWRYCSVCNTSLHINEVVTGQN